MFLLVPAHPGFPGQIPQSRKTVVCVCVPKKFPCLTLYGNVVWHPFLKKDTELLESIQHQATILVPGLRHTCYKDRLKITDPPSLLYCRLCGDTIKPTNTSTINTTLTELSFHSSDQTLWSFNWWTLIEILKSDCRTAVRANFFSYWIANFWNSLQLIQLTVSRDIFDEFCSQMRFFTNTQYL